MLLTIPTLKAADQDLSLSADEARFLVRASGRRPSPFSPLRLYADDAALDADALERAGRALEQRGVLVPTRDGLALCAPWASSVEILFAPAAVVDVVAYRRPGERLLRSVFWAEGAFLVACDARADGLRCSVPISRARWVSKLGAWASPGEALPWSRGIEHGLFKLCGLLAPAFDEHGATRDALVRGLDATGLNEHGPPGEIVDGLVSTGLLAQEGDLFRPAEPWALLWESLRTPETIVFSVEYPDGASDEELWVGPPGARCRIRTQPGEGPLTALGLSRPGEAALRERLLAWTDLVPVEQAQLSARG